MFPREGEPLEDLFNSHCAGEIKQRLSHLTAHTQRQWGKMTVTQMLAHCSRSIEMASGQIRPQRALIGRILGPIIKPMALREGEPMRKNSPTAKELVIGEMLDFNAEQARLEGLIDRFVANGPAGCTSHPHAFFGSLRPGEWSILMYKHLDHHLRQFGA
jgi:hypothetical protein